MGKRGSVSTMGKRTSGKKTAVSPNSILPSRGMSKLAVTVWKQVVPSFPLGHFTEGDRVLLEHYCEAAALHKEATAAVISEGLLIDGGAWGKKRNPALDIQSQARRDCAMLATKLRITKQAMISPKSAGRAAQDAAEAAAVENTFTGLLFEEHARQ